MDGLLQLQEFILGRLPNILLAVVILILTAVTAKLVRKFLDKYLSKSSRLIRADPTQYNFLKHAISGLIYAIGIGLAIFTIPELQTLSVSIFAGAGILAIVIGFASQKAFSNIVSGIFISIFKPFGVGDRVRVGTDIYGIVEDITLRHTIIRTFENKRVIIPNAVISDAIIINENLGDEKICKFVEFGISYDSDINKAMKIMQEEAMKHPYFLDNRNREEKKKNDPAVAVKVTGFGDSSVNLRAYVWSPDPKAAFMMGCDLNKSIKERFDKEGIEIPFPYRTIVYKKDIDR
jgi:small conductance mechanosensitive channel